MRRAIGSIVVLFLLGGLFVKYRDGRSLMARPATQGTAMARYGSNSANASNPPIWSRRKGVFPPAAPAYLPRDSSVEPPHATFLPKPAQPAIPPAPKPASDQSVAKVPGRATAPVSGRTTQGPDAVAQEEYRVLLRHAQFLIQAGLAPMAKEPLQPILRGV